MSYHSSDDRRYKKDSRRRRPKYEEEEIIESHGSSRPSRQTDLVPRRDDSVEDIEREFPPGDPYAQRRGGTRRARSDPRHRYDNDDYYDDRRRGKRYDERKSKRRSYYESSSSSESPPRERRRKSLSEQALAALGLGGAAAAATSGRDRSRSRGRGNDRHRRYSSDYSSRSRSRSVEQSKKIQQAVKAAITAGAAEAFRSRKDPGGWGGAKGKRVLTAAIGAGGIDGIINKDKDPDKKSTRHTIEAAIAGLAGNRILNGPRDKSRSRSRARSHRGDHGSGGGGGGLKDLAVGGLAAAAGKAFLDSRNRSKSRGRRSSSSDSDSRSPVRRKKRSKSVSDYISKGMAAVGIGDSGKDKRRDDNRDPRGSRRNRDYDDYYSSRDAPPQQGRLRGGGGEGGDGIRNSSSSRSSSSSDLGDISSSEEDRIQRKLHGKELLTTGLAGVATIHAAHSVYKSVENRKKRSKLVREGEMSPEKARSLKNKARLQDAAAVGIAALGIKSAVGEWKEMKEQRHEYHEFEHKRALRHERRIRKLEEQAYANGYRQRQSDFALAQAGPQYHDDNPYSPSSVSSPPPPPMGSQQTRYH